MKCKKCGRELKDGYKFCSACGEKVENGSKALSYEKNSKNSGNISSIDNDNSDSTCASKSSKKKLSDMKFELFIVAVITISCIIFAVCHQFYSVYKVKAEKRMALDSIKQFEYNAVLIRCFDEWMDISYYDEESPVIINCHLKDGISYSAYYPKGAEELCCLFNSDTFPLPNAEICKKSKIDDLLQSLQSVEFYGDDEHDDMCIVQVNEEEEEKAMDICNMTLGLFSGEEYERPLSEFDAYLWDERIVLCCKSDECFTIELRTVDKEETYKDIKARILNSYSSDWLKGEYYQPDTNNTLVITDKEPSIDDDLNVYRTVVLNGEEKNVPYGSCDWIEGGCTLDGVEYTFTSEYLAKLEFEKDFDFIRSICKGEKEVVTEGWSSDAIISFEDVYCDEASGHIVAEVVFTDKNVYASPKTKELTYYAYCNENRTKVFLKDEKNNKNPKRMYLDTYYTEGIFKDVFQVY